MAELKCPVCGATIDVNSTTICTVCGFEYRIFSSPLPEDVDAVEKKRIEIAKRNYESLSSCQNENERLCDQVNALNDQIAQLKKELEENAVKEAKVPFYLLQEDTRTGRHKLHHLEAGVHSFGGDVAAGDVVCDFHHTIDASSPLTQFIIKAIRDDSGKYSFFIQNHADERLFVNNIEVQSEMRINPGGSISLETYEFQLLRA